MGQGGELSAWDITGELEAPTLMHNPAETVSNWALVFINGTLYDFTHVELMYNYMIGGESIVFNVTWKIHRQPYTAECCNYVEDRYMRETLLLEYHAEGDNL